MWEVQPASLASRQRVHPSFEYDSVVVGRPPLNRIAFRSKKCNYFLVPKAVSYVTKDISGAKFLGSDDVKIS